MSTIEIVNGLHALADFIDDYSWVMDTRAYPGIPLTINYPVGTAMAVQEIAESAGVPVEIHQFDDGTTTRATIRRGGVELTAFYIGVLPREIARPVEVTERLAEVEG